MSSPRLARCDQDLDRARDLIGLGQSIGSMTHGAVDASDLLRASLVMSVAALDHYVHGVVLDRAADIVMGRRPPGAETKVGVSFAAVQGALSAATDVEREQLMRAHIAQKLSFETFQKPDAISAALASVGVRKVWKAAFGDAPPTTDLSLIVGRRNRIVHQADSDPLVLGARTPIADDDAKHAFETVRTVVHGLDPHCG